MVNQPCRPDRAASIAGRTALPLLFVAAVVAFPSHALANCQNMLTAQTVVPTDNLTNIIEKSTPPCTLTVNAGTYNAQVTDGTNDAIFRLSTGITVRSAGGPGVTILQVAAGKSFSLIVQPLFGTTCPNGAILDGFTIRGGNQGILAFPDPGGCPGNTLQNVTLRNLIVTPNAGANAHGIEFKTVQNSVIDSVTVNPAGVNGIILYNLSHGNLIMNSTILGTRLQHGLAIQGSNGNVVVGNTISNAGNVACGACDGILLNSFSGTLATPGSTGNRIERNTVSDYRTDGITLTDGSRANYVGGNTISSTRQTTAGVGIWVNNDSNGTYLYGNDASGAPENGIDVLTSKSAYLHGNRVHDNVQGGIWVANYLFAADANAAVPQDIVLHSNYSYFNALNGQINLEGVVNPDVAYNFLSGQDAGPLPGIGELAGTNTAGILVHEGGLTTRGSDVATSGLDFYENAVSDVNSRAIVYGTTQNALFFRNRFLHGSNDPNAPSGRRGLTYSLFPAGVQWDASRFLGGNHWSEFTQAVGNPDTTHPYRFFVYDDVHGNDGSGPYADKFPYGSSSLPAVPYATPRVAVLEPVEGQQVAAGTKKTIRWIARGCTLVDISLGGTGAGPIATNYPNVGYFIWTVPAAPASASAFIQVDCKDATGGFVGVSDSTPNFQLNTSALQLLSPGRDFRATNGGTVRVAWRKNGAGAGVQIRIKSAGGAETLVATNIGGTFQDITIPGSIANDGLVSIRITDTINAFNQDSVDGSIIVAGTPTFMTNLPALSPLQIGAIVPLRWAGTPTSALVDLDLYENGVFARTIVKNLPDFGNYDWFVPEMWSVNSTILATFKDITGAQVVGQVTSGAFRVFYQTTPGVAVNRYRLYSPLTLEHLFTTDLNEYNVLGTFPPEIWQQEGVASKLHNGPANLGGLEAIPYYRLYDTFNRWHHWTTDRNEYFTLRTITSIWIAEGVDGYIFPVAGAPGTVPWYRLHYPLRPGLHHWTLDQNERDTLVGSGFWVEEQKEYVLP